MNLIEYLKYLVQKENYEENEIVVGKSLSTIDEEIQEKLSKLDRIIKENKIKYTIIHLIFYFYNHNNIISISKGF